MNEYDATATFFAEFRFKPVVIARALDGATHGHFLLSVPSKEEWGRFHSAADILRFFYSRFKP